MLRSVAITLTVAFSAISAGAATVNKRIVNGEDATSGEFPSMVSLHGRFDNHICGGVLLNQTTVLTAAHCVGYDDSQTHYTIKAGTLVSLVPPFLLGVLRPECLVPW